MKDHYPNGVATVMNLFCNICARYMTVIILTFDRYIALHLVVMSSSHCVLKIINSAPEISGLLFVTDTVMCFHGDVHVHVHVYIWKCAKPSSSVACRIEGLSASQRVVCY